jgi:hypothetical protein
MNWQGMSEMIPLRDLVVVIGGSPVKGDGGRSHPYSVKKARKSSKVSKYCLLRSNMTTTIRS